VVVHVIGRSFIQDNSILHASTILDGVYNLEHRQQPAMLYYTLFTSSSIQVEPSVLPAETEPAEKLHTRLCNTRPRLFLASTLYGELCNYNKMGNFIQCYESTNVTLRYSE